MSPATRARVHDTPLTGMTAGAVSTLALLWVGRRETGRAAAPLNAVSHWLWGRRALHRDRASPRYTLPGLLIHQGASTFWAAVYQAAFDARLRGRPLPALAAGSAVSALACFVDFRLTPQRLTPGFEHRLSRGALALVYLSFGLGLALTDVRRRRR